MGLRFTGEAQKKRSLSPPADPNVEWEHPLRSRFARLVVPTTAPAMPSSPNWNPSASRCFDVRFQCNSHPAS